VQSASGRARLVESQRLVFVALEHGATWHWAWAVAHGFGFEHGVLVGQRPNEPLEQFHARAREGLRAVRRDGGRVGLAALCVAATTRHAVVAPRFRLANALLADSSAELAHLLLTAADPAPLMRGHLLALAEALSDSAPPEVRLEVCVGSQPAVEISRRASTWRRVGVG